VGINAFGHAIFFAHFGASNVLPRVFDGQKTTACWVMAIWCTNWCTGKRV